jgi:hypothetical protein
MNLSDPIARRERIRRTLRYGGLGTLAGLATWLGRRPVAEPCTVGGPCGGCPQFDACALLRARSAKRPDPPAAGSSSIHP